MAQENEVLQAETQPELLREPENKNEEPTAAEADAADVLVSENTEEKPLTANDTVEALLSDLPPEPEATAAPDEVPQEARPAAETEALAEEKPEEKPSLEEIAAEKTAQEIAESLEENPEKDEEKDAEPDEPIEHRDYAAEIVAAVRKGLPPMALKERLLTYHENDIAEALDSLTADERSRVFSLLDAHTLADVLEYAQNVTYFSELSARKQLAVLSEIEADEAVSYLRALPKDVRKLLIDLMDDDDKKEIALIGSFDEDEIGSRMTTNYIRIRENISIRDAMHELVKQAAEHDNISKLYVVDAHDGFYGAIDLKDLIIARENTPLRELIMSSYPYVYAHEQISDCIERIKGYYEDSIPVLDDTNRLLGVITSTDVVEIADDEMNDDYAKLAGLSAEADLQEPTHESVRKRLPWLMILLGLGMVVSSVVSLFESVIESLPIIVSFQSLVLGMAGNVGTQSLAVTIRVLMDENLTGKQKRRLVWKELSVGAGNGLVLGGASLVIITLYLYLLRHQPIGASIAISACTSIALFVSMILASLAGTTVPLLFKKLKVDPAVASGPLITTINDLCSVVMYYGLAWLLLIKVLKL